MFSVMDECSGLYCSESCLYKGIVITGGVDFTCVCVCVSCSILTHVRSVF